MNYIAGLNGVRAFAVAAVVWHHSPRPDSMEILNHGFLGVDVFFVLSGFLITSLLLQEKSDTGTISLFKFYARRTLRIFPLYYAVLGILAIYSLYRGDVEFLSELPYHLTYTSNWFEVSGLMEIGWSLSTEEQFYLLWPPLLAVLAGTSSVRLLLVFLLANQAVNFGVLDQWLPRQSLAILQCTFTPIILGSLLAYVLRDHGEKLSRLPAMLTIGVSLSIMLLAASLPEVQGMPRLIFHLATAAFLAGLVLNPGSKLVRVFEFAPIAYVGKVSYGVYLLHMIAMHFTQRLPADVVFVCTLALTICMAAVSYTFFERPILGLKTRYEVSKPLAPSALIPAEADEPSGSNRP